MARRIGFTYKILERIRAGLGAAGAVAVLAEGVSSSRMITGVFGLSTLSSELADIAIGLIAFLAFIVTSYIVDVPSSSEQDVDR